MTTRNKVTQYLKNVNKSIVFAAIDVESKKSQNTASFIATNKDLFKDIYSGTKDLKETIGKTSKSITDSNVYKAADVGMKALKDDLKTGKWYNKERTDEMALKSMGDLGDFSSGFSDLDFDFDSSDSNFTISNDSKVVANSVQTSTMTAAEATCNMIANSTEYFVNVSKANTALLLSQNARLSAIVNEGFIKTNENISKISDVMTGPLVNHMQNSKKYYEVMTTSVDSIVGMLKEINERQKTIYENSKQKTNSRSGMEYDDIVDGYGAPDLKKYAKAIKNNAKKMAGPEFDLIFGQGMGPNSNMLLNYAASPLMFPMMMLAKSFIPARLETDIKKFDKTLSSSFNNFIANMNRLSKNGSLFGGFGSKIGELLGIGGSMKSTINTSKYNKGPMPFDGETKKAITEVIPTHLRRIERLLGSSDSERIYDYNTGKWTTDKEVANRARNIRKDSVNSAFSDVKPSIEKSIEKYLPDDFEEYEEVMKNLNNLLNQIYEDYGSFRFNDKKTAKKYSKYGVDNEEMMKVFMQAFSDLPRDQALDMTNKVMRSRADTTRKMNYAEENGMDSLINYFNGSMDGSPSSKNSNGKFVGYPNMLNMSKDDKGHNVFFYLRNISSEIHAIRTSGTNGKGRKVASTTADDKFLDTVPDDNTDKAKYNKDRQRASEYYDKKIANLKANGKMSKVGSIDTFMSEDESRAIISEMTDQEYAKYLREVKEMEKFETPGQRGVRQWVEAATISGKKDEKGKKMTVLDKLIQAESAKEKFNVAKETAANIYQIPTKALEKILETADKKIYEIMFGYKGEDLGPDGKPVRGFMGHMLNELRKSFDNFNKYINDNILDPIKKSLGIDNFGQLFEKIADNLGFGKDKRHAFFKRYTDEIKKTFGGAGRQVRSSLSRVYGPAFDFFGIGPKAKKKRDFKKNAHAPEFLDTTQEDMYEKAMEAQNNPEDDEDISGVFGFAKGTRYVKKSGITAISKGELIIPSDMNPFNPDRNKVNRKKELATEKKIKNNYIKNMLNNDIGINADGTTTEEDRRSFREKSSSKSSDYIDQAKKTFEETFERLFGTDEKDREKAQDAIGQAFKKVHEYAPTAVAGGLLGGGVSLITGMVGGPLLGAAVGASIGIVKKSGALQNWLFGEVGQDGERNGGVVSKNFQEKFKQYYPNLRDFGIAGTITGLITPLGPIGGLMVGSAIGFAKSNKSLQTYLFGEQTVDKNGNPVYKEGLIKKATQKNLKQALPKAVAGSLLAVALHGPFGLVGNMMFGAGMGALTATETFKRIMLGEEDENGDRKGGIVGAIKEGVIDPLKDSMRDFKERFLTFMDENVFDPLKRFIEPTIQQISNIIGGIGRSINNTFKNMIYKSIGQPIEIFVKDRIEKLKASKLGKIFTGVFKAGRSVLTSPFKILGNIGDVLRRHQIKTGQAYDMSAGERLSFMQQRPGAFNKKGKRPYKLKESDELMAGMSDKQIIETNSLLGEAMHGKDYYNKALKGEKKNLFNQVYNYLHDTGLDKTMSYKDRNAILQEAQYGNVDKISKMLNGRFGKGKNAKRLSKEDRNELMGMLREGSAKITDLNNKKNSDFKSTDELLSELDAAGLKGINKKNLYRYKKMFNNEKQFRRFTDGEQFIEDSNDPVIAALNKEMKDTVEKKTDKIISILERMVTLTQYSIDPKSVDTTKISSDDPAFKIYAKNMKKNKDKFDKKEEKSEKIEAKRDAKDDKQAQKTLTKLNKNYAGIDTSDIKGIDTDAVASRVKSINKFSRKKKGFAADTVVGLVNMKQEDYDFVADVQKYVRLDQKQIDRLKKFTPLQREKVKMIMDTGHKLDGDFASVEAIAKANVKTINRVVQLINGNRIKKKFSIPVLINEAKQTYTPLGDNTRVGIKRMKKAFKTYNKEQKANAKNGITESNNIMGAFDPVSQSEMQNADQPVTGVRKVTKLIKEKSKGITRIFNPLINKFEKFDKNGEKVSDSDTKDNKNLFAKIKDSFTSFGDKIKNGENFLGKIYVGLFGKKDERGDYIKEGFFNKAKKVFDKVFGGLKTALSIIGIIAAGIIGVAGIGHASYWWLNQGGKEAVTGFTGKIWNNIKKVVVGTKGINGYLEGGIRGILFGDKNAAGTLQGGLRGLLFGSRKDKDSSYEGGILSSISNSFMSWWDRAIQPGVSKIHNFFDPWISGKVSFKQWLDEDVWGSYDPSNPDNSKGIKGWIWSGLDKFGIVAKEIWEGTGPMEGRGLKEKLSELWEGTNGDGGIKGWISDASSALWSSLKTNLQDWYENRDKAKQEGIEAVNDYNESGKSFASLTANNPELRKKYDTEIDQIVSKINNNTKLTDDEKAKQIAKATSKLQDQYTSTYVNNRGVTISQYPNTRGLVVDGSTKYKSFYVLYDSPVSLTSASKRKPLLAIGSKQLNATNTIHNLGIPYNYFEKKNVSNMPTILNELENGKHAINILDYINMINSSGGFIDKNNQKSKININNDMLYDVAHNYMLSGGDPSNIYAKTDNGKIDYNTYAKSGSSRSRSIPTIKSNIGFARSNVTPNTNNTSTNTFSTDKLLGGISTNYTTYSDDLSEAGAFNNTVANTVTREINNIRYSSNFGSIFAKKAFDDPTKTIIYWTNKILSFPLYIAKYMQAKIAQNLSNNSIVGSARGYNSTLDNYVSKYTKVSVNNNSNANNNSSTSSSSSNSKSASSNTSSKSSNNIFSIVGEKFRDWKEDVSRFFTGSSRNDGLVAYGRSDNDHLYQKNYSSMKYGNSTIGETGCGPVAAANLLNSMGSNTNVASTAKYAERNGFVSSDGGTDINYFNSILNANGVQSSQSNNAGDVYNALANGSKAVLLGQDSTNSISEPYSNRMHFITAKGLDKNGNVIVEDPDLPNGTRTFSPNKLFKGFKSSVIAGSGRRIFGLARRVNGDDGMGNKFTLDTSSSTSSSNGYVSTTSSLRNTTTSVSASDSSMLSGALNYDNIIDPNEKAILIAKIAERTMGSESSGNYDAISKNDNGAYSVGIIQFHGSNAKNMFTRIAELCTNPSDRAEALKWANASGRALSSSEADQMKAFLNKSSVKDISKHVQDQKANELYWDVNAAAAVDLLQQGKIKDPRSIVMVAHIANSGPAWANSWAKTYTGSKSSSSCLGNVRDSLLTQSNWAFKGTADNRKGWAKLINDDYDVLKTWDGSMNGSGTLTDSGTDDSSDGSSSGNTIFDKFGTLSNSVLNYTYGKDTVDKIMLGVNGSSSSSSSNNNYDTTSYNSSGNVSSNATIANYQKKTADFMHRYQGKNDYSQLQRNKQDKGYSDCSSMVEWALRNGIGDSEYSMTGSGSGSSYNAGTTFTQWLNNHAMQVDNASTGHPNEDNLQLGDVLIYGTSPNSPTTGSTKHAAMYTGKGEAMGHGNGKGPKVYSLNNAGSNPYYGAMRFINMASINAGLNTPGGTLTGQLTGTGRGDDECINCGTIANKMIKNSMINNDKFKSKHHATTTAIHRPSGMGRQGTTDISSNVPETGSNIDVLFSKVMNIVVEVLCRIADDTDKLSEITKLLNDKLNTSVTKEEVTGAARAVQSGTSSTELNSFKNAILDGMKKAQAPGSSSQINSNSLMNKDTEYILSQMSTIAAQ